MQELINFINTNAISIILGLSILLIITFIIAIVALSKASKSKAMYEKILGGSGKDSLEEILLDYYTRVKAIDDRYSDIQREIRRLEKDMEPCIQKVAMVRYNPFQETGGNLCYALAMLNNKNDGVLLNSIYSRDGSYNYGKAIIDGKSEYTLSKEEQEVLNIATRDVKR